MNTFSTRIKPLDLSWPQTIALVLSLWLGGTLLLDLVVMPSMYVSGMMQEPGFASVGYTLFGMVNRIEVVCAALTLTGLLAWNYSGSQHLFESKTTVIFAGLLFLIPLFCLYGLTPWMSSMSLPLGLFQTPRISPEMLSMQAIYWGVESLKMAGMIVILGVCYRYNNAAQSH